jgi:hypothetical protein
LNCWTSSCIVIIQKWNKLRNKYWNGTPDGRPRASDCRDEADYEETTARFEAKIDSHHEQLMAKMKAGQ